VAASGVGAGDAAGTVADAGAGAGPATGAAAGAGVAAGTGVAAGAGPAAPGVAAGAGPGADEAVPTGGATGAPGAGSGEAGTVVGFSTGSAGFSSRRRRRRGGREASRSARRADSARSLRFCRLASRAARRACASSGSGASSLTGSPAGFQTHRRTTTPAVRPAGGRSTRWWPPRVLSPLVQLRAEVAVWDPVRRDSVPARRPRAPESVHGLSCSGPLDVHAQEARLPGFVRASWEPEGGSRTPYSSSRSMSMAPPLPPETP